MNVRYEVKLVSAFLNNCFGSFLEKKIKKTFKILKLFFVKVCF